MRCLRPLLVLAGIVAVVLASEAQFRQAPGATGPTPTPLAATLLNAIDDPNLVAELKLSEDQVKKLVARRQEVWDEYYVTALNRYAEGAEGRVEATNAAFKKTLTADQYKRAVQIAAQQVLRNRMSLTFATTTAIFKTYPELVVAFQLTAEQKQQITDAPRAGPGGKVGPGGKGGPAGKGGFPGVLPPGGGFPGGGGFAGGAIITLSAQQTAAAKEFMGPTFAKTWVAKSDPRLLNVPGQPANLLLLATADVKADVKLTNEQAEKITILREKWANLNQITEYSPKGIAELVTQLAAESEKTLATTLTAEQTTRLKQITFQKAHTKRDVDWLYTEETVSTELALTMEQVTKLDELWQTFQEKATKAIEANEPLASIEKKVRELSAQRLDKATVVLTPVQVTKLQGLFGEPFIGRNRPDVTFPGPDPRDRPTRTSPLSDIRRKASFGKYSNELSQLASNRSLQKELKLTEEQVKKVSEASEEIQTKFPLPRATTSPTRSEAYVKAVDERSKAVETSLEKLLTGEQAKRFREIILQALKHAEDATVRTVNPTTVLSPISYPGVAEAVKLTDEQKQQMVSLTAPDKVLTRDQKDAIAKMLGEPFKGTLPDVRVTALTTLPPRPAPVRLTIPPLLRLSNVNAKSLEEMLKLTPEQTKTITAAVAAYQATSDKVGLLLASERRVADTAFEKAIAGVLTADQEKRVAQLIVQLNAATNLATTLTAPEMVKTLELTLDQTDDLTALEDETMKLQALIVAEQVSDPDSKLALHLQDVADNQMFARLTDAQKAKWKELTGEPWQDLKKKFHSQAEFVGLELAATKSRRNTDVHSKPLTNFVSGHLDLS